jgi:hypothetical protein
MYFYGFPLKIGKIRALDGGFEDKESRSNQTTLAISVSTEQPLITLRTAPFSHRQPDHQEAGTLHVQRGLASVPVQSHGQPRKLVPDAEHQNPVEQPGLLQLLHLLVGQHSWPCLLLAREEECSSARRERAERIQCCG